MLNNGIIKALGYIPQNILQLVDSNMLDIQDLHGAWVTPGLVDLHSHIGVSSAPSLRGEYSISPLLFLEFMFFEGADDGNSRHGPILPWLRSIDAINTHDDAYRLSIAGGVTTAQVLPGSANNIGMSKS